MDIALNYFDEYLGDSLYAHLENPFAKVVSSLASNVTASLPPVALSPVTSFLASIPSLSSLPRDNIVRQSLSLYAIVYVAIHLMYFSVGALSYWFIFDHRMMLHPRWLKNQVQQEMKCSLAAFPFLDLLTLPWFVGDVRGKSFLYDTIAEGPFGAQGGWKPWAYMAFSAGLFLFLTDYMIYWAHRWLHVPFIYRNLHKPHHKWIIPSPFASHAFHPVDGYIQSVPYHLCCYLFPIHKYLFIGLFSFVNFWSVFIHDSDMITDSALIDYINGPAHHTLHHIYFTCNYGQYFTWSDRAFGSFRKPAREDDPLIAALAAKADKEQFAANLAAARKAGGYKKGAGDEDLEVAESKKTK